MVMFEFLFPDRLSHRPRSGQSGVWLSVFCGANEVWGGLHLVRTARCRWSVTASPSLQRRWLSRVSVSVSSSGGKVTTTGWATARTTTFDDPDKFRGCKEKRLSPSPRGHCTVCAAQRTVGLAARTSSSLLHMSSTQFGCSDQFSLPSCHLVSLTPNSSAKLCWTAASQEALLVLFGSGEVYTWGDNDEGQLGDGTTNAIQRPRLVAALQGKKINRVACGSAHTLAWSTSKPTNAGKLPTQVRHCFLNRTVSPLPSCASRCQ